jgi:hypothetical protein
MSTRCSVHFTDEGSDRVQANVYRHYDGDPETAQADLAQFFRDVQAQTPDTRFSDASYLAAKYVVWQAGQAGRYAWQAGQYARVPGELEFTGVGVQVNDPLDIDYVHTVECRAEGLPIVTSREA